MNDVREVIQNTLDGVNSTADQQWAFDAAVTQFTNPGLTLQSSGIVGLPLSYSDALRIAKEASVDGQDIFSKDTSSCYCGLSREKFELRNPAWHQSVIDIGSRILGKQANEVRAELTNLSLHAPSAVDRRPHLASARHTGRHLVLLICLPSAHTGGDIVCSVGADSKRFATSVASGFEISYIAAYSDARRESTPIKSGIRLLLTYNVFLETGFGIGTASGLAGYAKDFENELLVWRRLCRCSGATPILVYVLDDYCGIGHQVSTLREEDKLKARYLRERCAAAEVYPYLGTMKCTIDEYEVDGTSLELENFVDFDDSDVLEGHVQIDLEYLIQKDIFEDRESNDSEFGEDPFEETYVHHYVDSVFVLVPENYRLGFLVRHSNEKEQRDLISRLLNDTQSGDLKNETKEELATVAGDYASKIKKPASSPYSAYSSYHNFRYGDTPIDPQVYYEQGLSMLILASILLQDKKFFARAISIDPGSMSQNTIREILESLGTMGFGLYREGLDAAARCFTTLHARYEFLKTMSTGYDEEAFPETSRNELDEWVLGHVEEMLSNLRTSSSSDAGVMLEMGLRYGAGFMLDMIPPAAKVRKSDFDFVCSFLQALSDHVADAAIQAQTAAALVTDILPAVIPFFTTHKTRSLKRQKLEPNPSSPCSSVPDDGNRMASVLEFCMTLGLINEAQALINSVKEELTVGDWWWLRCILMPFLTDSAAAMEKHNDLFRSKETQEFFQQGVSLFIAKYLGPKPQCPKDWSMPPRGCKCKDCWEQLDWFLRDPNSQHMEFKATGQRRDHLWDRVASEPSIRKTTRRNPRAPHTLVLDKTRDGYNQELQGWGQRCDEVKTLIDSMKLEILRQLLADKYSELTERSSAMTEKGSLGASRRSLAVTQAPAPVTKSNGIKGFVEVIDLEGD